MADSKLIVGASILTAAALGGFVAYRVAKTPSRDEELALRRMELELEYLREKRAPLLKRQVSRLPDGTEVDMEDVEVSASVLLCSGVGPQPLWWAGTRTGMLRL